jgi:hypothetical protein
MCAGTESSIFAELLMNACERERDGGVERGAATENATHSAKIAISVYNNYIMQHVIQSN